MSSSKCLIRFHNSLLYALNRCDDGLKIQKKLIKHDLKEYQRELEKNYHTFLTHMRPLFGQTSHHHAQGSPR